MALLRNADPECADPECADDNDDVTSAAPALRKRGRKKLDQKDEDLKSSFWQSFENHLKDTLVKFRGDKAGYNQ